MSTNVYKFDPVVAESTNDFIKHIISFNCEKIGKTFNDVSVEFFFKTPTCDKVNFVNNTNTLLSSITCFDDSPETLAIFTDISMDDYKYKKYAKYETGRKLFIFALEKGKHIIYNSSNASLFKCGTNMHSVLFINIFDSPNNTNNTFEPVVNKLSFIEDTVRNVEIKKILNFDFYQNLLYQKSDECIKFAQMLLDKENKNIEFTDIFDINYETNVMLTKKYGNVVQDIVEMSKFNFKLNRFCQRFTIKNLLSTKTCNWFIHEAEKYASTHGWETTNFKRHITADIDLSKLESIHDYFVKFELQNILEVIQQSYCLPAETQFNVTNLNLIKYSSETLSGIDRHTDSSFFTFNISLNSHSDYEGGGIIFDDGLIFKNNIGDMLIHSGLMDHVGLPLNKGIRYVLVGFVTITL